MATPHAVVNANEPDTGDFLLKCADNVATPEYMKAKPKIAVGIIQKGEGAGLQSAAAAVVKIAITAHIPDTSPKKN